MKTRELIALLSEMPQEAEVLYRFCSDYSVLKADDIKVQGSTDPLIAGHAIKHHNLVGEYRRYDGPREYKDKPLPVPVDAVIFPGN